LHLSVRCHWKKKSNEFAEIIFYPEPVMPEPVIETLRFAQGDIDAWLSFWAKRRISGMKLL
jgi:hypothetical protein